MIQAILGTGGHIDHGKTALVGALTGTDTDRLPEEKRRGISIDLGFTHLELEGARVGVVDVPGHEDFIRNMLAGTTGVDALLLVVAADEGVMPQTREHVAIAELLGVDRAVIALTKLDLVDPDWLALARDDVAELLAATPFASAPVIPCSAVTGEGIDAVRGAILDALPAPRRSPEDLFRMPVDRSFTVRGTGTVATGTVWSGTIRRDETVRLLPGTLEARVRGIQVHGAPVEAAVGGQRAAVALAGADVEDAGRGTTLVTDAAWSATSMLTVRLRVLPGSAWRIETRQRVRVHLGTAEVMARVVLLEVGTLEPGDEAWAQLRLESALVARAGDRFVVRSYSPVTTIGGGIVAEPRARKRKRLPRDVGSRLGARIGDDRHGALEATLAAARGRGLDVVGLPLETGATPADVDAALSGPDFVRLRGRAFPAEMLERTRRALADGVDAYHRSWPLRPGIDVEELRRLAGPDVAAVLAEAAFEAAVAEGELEVRDGRAARTGYAPVLTADQERLGDRVMATLTEAGLAPPAVDELRSSLGNDPDTDDLIRLLEARGRLVRVAPDMVFAANVLDDVIARVRERLAGRSGLGPADFKAVAPVSRKHLIPILEHLDRVGVTVRTQQGRSVPPGG